MDVARIVSHLARPYFVWAMPLQPCFLNGDSGVGESSAKMCCFCSSPKYHLTPIKIFHLCGIKWWSKSNHTRNLVCVVLSHLLASRNEIPQVRPVSWLTAWSCLLSARFSGYAITWLFGGKDHTNKEQGILLEGFQKTSHWLRQSIMPVSASMWNESRGKRKSKKTWEAPAAVLIAYFLKITRQNLNKNWHAYLPSWNVREKSVWETLNWAWVCKNIVLNSKRQACVDKLQEWLLGS